MKKQNNNKNLKEFLGALFFFILWPFGTLIYSLKNNKKVWAKNIFWIFCVFYGFTFIIYSPGVDAYIYAETFVAWNKLSWSYSNFISALYSTDTQFVDLFQPFLTFIISRFTDDTRILFAAFSFVFGFFYSRNLWYLFEKLDDRKSLITILFVVIFCLLIPIWRINGVRFWTAAHIFLYGTLPFLLHGDKKKLWVSVLSVFVHFTFFAPLLILFFYLVFGNQYKLYFTIFILTLLINELNLDFIKYQFESLPDVFQEKSSRYLYKDSIKLQAEMASTTNWYIRYYNLVLKWIAYIFIISLFLKSKKQIYISKSFSNLFCFSMLFYSFANLSNLMPQGFRFYNVSNMFVFFMLSYMTSEIKVPALVLKLRVYSVPILIILIVVTIRIGFDYIGLITFIGNPLVALLVENNIPLINYFK